MPRLIEGQVVLFSILLFAACDDDLGRADEALTQHSGSTADGMEVGEQIVTTVTLAGGPGPYGGPNPGVDPEDFSFCAFTRIRGLFDPLSYVRIGTNASTGVYELQLAKGASNPEDVEADTECIYLSEFDGTPDPIDSKWDYLELEMDPGEADSLSRQAYLACPWSGMSGALHFPYPTTHTTFIGSNSASLEPYEFSSGFPPPGPDHTMLFVNNRDEAEGPLSGRAWCAGWDTGNWIRPADVSGYAFGMGPYVDGEWIPANPAEYWCYISGVQYLGDVCADGCDETFEEYTLTTDTSPPPPFDSYGNTLYRMEITSGMAMSVASGAWVQCLKRDQTGGF
jgi:hypothetical protein